MSMYITFLHVQLLIYYTPNTENDYIKKNLIIHNYKNISIAFGPEYPLFIHYNCLSCTDSIFISLKRHMTFFTGFSNVTTVATNLTNPARESKHEMVNTILFGMIGLAAVLFIIYMIYIYTIALEKRLVYTAPI